MRTKLKGGSLSGTYLIQAATDYVRKECSSVDNREYGYMRWYSQLKRMQRYNRLFPGLFPQVYGYGVDGIMAYYDMEVVPGVNGYEFLCYEQSQQAIRVFFNKLILAMTKMHSTQWKSPHKPDLYIQEEVRNKLMDYGARIGDFGLIFDFDDFKQELMQNYSETKECYTHGNLTLENVMYDPKTEKVTFIDPYEENVIDSRLCDYSQILQSCHSHYEHHNSGSMDPVPTGLEYFYTLFHDTIYSNLSEKRKRVVDLLEISQFIRMLPFKKQAGHLAQADFFYSHAIKLFKQYQIKWNPGTTSNL